MAPNSQSKAEAALERLQQANDALHRWRPRASRVADIRRSLARRIASAPVAPVPAEDAPSTPSPVNPSPAAPSPADPAGREPPPRLGGLDGPRPIGAVPVGAGRPPPSPWSRIVFRARRLDRSVRRVVAQLVWRLSRLRLWYRRRR